MVTTGALTENSRQGINSQIPPCIGLGSRLSPNPRPGCGHAYDETPVGLVVYVRNDPVNFIDPDGRLMAAFFSIDWPEEGQPTVTWTYYSERGGSYGGSGGRNWLAEWNMLNSDCRKGLKDALPAPHSSPATAAMLRLQALDRARAAEGDLQDVEMATSLDWVSVRRTQVPS